MKRQTYRNQSRGGSGGPINFTPEAERRGIQRAAIELALNLLATNQEQNRPQDRFRMVDLPRKVPVSRTEVPLCMSLKPEDRPLEQGPLDYTRKMLAFRRWKDYDYDVSRTRSNISQNVSLLAPDNFNGPASVATVDDLYNVARKQLNELASVQKGLIDAEKTAPRPLIEYLLLLVDAGLNDDDHIHELYDDEKLTTEGVNLLGEIAGESWDELRDEYGDDIQGVQNTINDRARLEEFEQDIAELAEIPLWEPGYNPDYMDNNSWEQFTQIEHHPAIPSTQGMTGDEVRQITGNRRMANAESGTEAPHLWDLRTVTRYLRAMASVSRIQ
jgi:hypothetical protein